jgi:hypothetical protein
MNKPIYAVMLAATALLATSPAKAVSEQIGPCQYLTRLSCDAGVLGYLRAIKEDYPDKVNVSLQEIDNATQKLFALGEQVEGAMQKHLQPAAVQGCLRDMGAWYDRMKANNPFQSIGEFYTACREESQVIGRTYDGQVMQASASQKAPLYTPQTVATDSSGKMSLQQDTAPASSPESSPLLSRVKELEKQVDSQYETLKQMDEAKPAHLRTREEQEAMDAQAMKLLESIGQMTDAQRSYFKENFKPLQGSNILK